MKKTLRWLGWGAAAVIGLVVFFNADKTTQWVAMLLALACWVLSSYESEAKKRREAMAHRLDRLEQKLDALLDHPLNTQGIADGIQGIVDEYHDRKRATDRGPRAF